MSENEIPYIYFDTAIKNAVKMFSNGHSIEDRLSAINSDITKLTCWSNDTNILNDTDEYVYLLTEEQLFISYDDILDYCDNILDYYPLRELELKADLGILDFITNGIENILDNSAYLQYAKYGGVWVSISYQTCGQDYVYIMDFRIFNSKDDCINYYIEQGYILYSDRIVSHSKPELISMFKRNTIDKYFKR